MSWFVNVPLFEMIYNRGRPQFTPFPCVSIIIACLCLSVNNHKGTLTDRTWSSERGVVGRLVAKKTNVLYSRRATDRWNTRQLHAKNAHNSPLLTDNTGPARTLPIGEWTPGWGRVTLADACWGAERQLGRGSGVTDDGRPRRQTC